MEAQVPHEKETDRKFADVYQDLECPEAYTYIITRGRIYQFDTELFISLLKRRSRKSIATDEVGFPVQLDGEEPADEWVRWQSKGHNL